jgi:hypothetical protein
MLGHYFGEELSAAQRRAVAELLSGDDGSLVMTPAMMEQVHAPRPEHSIAL